MNSDKLYQPMTEEELIKTAHALRDLEREESHLKYLSELYESSQLEYANQYNKLLDMKKLLDKVRVKEV